MNYGQQPHLPYGQGAPTGQQRQYQQSQHHQQQLQQQRPQQLLGKAPYPPQPYPGFVSYQQANYSSESISARVQNRDETMSHLSGASPNAANNKPVNEYPKQRPLNSHAQDPAIGYGQYSQQAPMQHFQETHHQKDQYGGHNIPRNVQSQQGPPQPQHQHSGYPQGAHKPVQQQHVQHQPQQTQQTYHIQQHVNQQHVNQPQWPIQQPQQGQQPQLPRQQYHPQDIHRQRPIGPNGPHRTGPPEPLQHAQQGQAMQRPAYQQLQQQHPEKQQLPSQHQLQRSQNDHLRDNQLREQHVPLQAQQLGNTGPAQQPPISQRVLQNVASDPQYQQPPAQRDIQQVQREATRQHLTESFESLAISNKSQNDPLALFNELKSKSETTGLNDATVQVEWVVLLMELATNRDFVSQYTLSGAPMRSGVSPSEIKKNEHAYIKLAIKTLKRACSELKDAEARFILGSLYSNSPSIKVPKPDILEQNLEKAFSHYDKAASQGHALALYRVGVSYELGIGTSVNEQKALDFFSRSAEAGSPAAMFKLGIIYSRGVLGAPRSAARSVECLQRAAENATAENPHALFELSKILERDLPYIDSRAKSDVEYLRELDRIGFGKDDNTALYYCKEAAKLAYAPSQCKLGWCYEYGKMGCVIDAKKSIGWYSRAAKQGNPQAEMALSGWYLTGAKGILETSDREAFLWAMKSAEGGFAKAEYALGYYYEVGLGCDRDIEMARKFYQRAATQGHEKAIEKLRMMRGK